MKDKILVVIPTYNCEKQISRLLAGFNPELQKYVDTILIINNQSTDNTEAIAIDHLKKLKNTNGLVLRNAKNYGYGGSLKIGFEFAVRHSFDWVIVVNGDDQSPITDFLPMLKFEKYKRYDVMWGARFLKNSQIRNYSYLRIIANYVFNFLFSVALRKRVHDIGCGVYMYSTKILKERFYIKMPDVLYIGTFLRLAHDFYKHKLAEFPISWNSDDQDSSVKVISQTLAQFKLAVQYLLYKDKFFSEDQNLSRADKTVSKVIFSNSLAEYDLTTQGEFLTSYTKIKPIMLKKKVTYKKG